MSARARACARVGGGQFVVKNNGDMGCPTYQPTGHTRAHTRARAHTHTHTHTHKNTAPSLLRGIDCLRCAISLLRAVDAAHQQSAPAGAINVRNPSRCRNAGSLCGINEHAHAQRAVCTVSASDSVGLLRRP